jgi:RNA polymerase-binding protein DksA
MRSDKLERYRQRLLDERGQLVHQMDRIRESIPEEVHPTGEHEIAPSEGIDVDISLATEEGTRLREIDAALDRIKERTFGKCCQCGNEIAGVRLEAVPDARYCMDCERSLHDR